MSQGVVVTYNKGYAPLPNPQLSVISPTGQEYSGHIEGHLESGEICCPECGVAMQREGTDKKAVGWFERNKDDESHVAKYGTSKTGRPWYLLKLSGFEGKRPDEVRKWLKHLVACGFSVGGIEEDEATYRVEMPNVAFRCREESCGHKLDVSQIYAKREFSRLAALRLHPAVARAMPYPSKQI